MLSSCRHLPYEDVWKMFGEGKHPDIRNIYESKLAPFLTQASGNFWNNRLWYFDKGLYYQGGQVRLWQLQRLHHTCA
jgi:betaine lipid synthase